MGKEEPFEGAVPAGEGVFGEAVLVSDVVLGVTFDVGVCVPEDFEDVGAPKIGLGALVALTLSMHT